jgi:type IV pilus assembly protein PilF
MRLTVFAVAAFAAALLAACATTTTGTAGGAPAATGGNGSRAAADPGDADRRAAVRMELASLHFSRGQYETALDEIKLALAAKPDLGAAFSLRGLVYASMGEEALAEESFARALQINPRDADTMHNRAWFLCQRDRFAEADRLFEQALAVPQYRGAERTFLAQGVCLSRAGRLDEAERKLSRAYELDPSNPTTAMSLAEVLYRRGEYERARFYIRRVNTREELSNAQTLWLALRIENRLGNRSGVEDFGRALRNRFPQAPETLAYERGKLDD